VQQATRTARANASILSAGQSRLEEAGPHKAQRIVRSVLLQAGRQPRRQLAPVGLWVQVVQDVVAVVVGEGVIDDLQNK
jgi:hypothetical protein